MSSGVIINGGTAENFSSADIANHDNYDHWEPEDLVATVQFLATLDERQMLPYVLPEDNRETTINGNSLACPTNLPFTPALTSHLAAKSSVPLKLAQLQHNSCDIDDLVLDSDSCSQLSPLDVSEAATIDPDGVDAMEVTDSMSSNEADASEPLINAKNRCVNLSDTLVTSISESYIVGLRLNRDNGDNNSSASQTPCSTEERSIIRASNKPTHIKR